MDLIKKIHKNIESVVEMTIVTCLALSSFFRALNVRFKELYIPFSYEDLSFVLERWALTAALIGVVWIGIKRRQLATAVQESIMEHRSEQITEKIKAKADAKQV